MKKSEKESIETIDEDMSEAIQTIMRIGEARKRAITEIASKTRNKLKTEHQKVPNSFITTYVLLINLMVFKTFEEFLGILYQACCLCFFCLDKCIHLFS